VPLPLAALKKTKRIQQKSYLPINAYNLNLLSFHAVNDSYSVNYMEPGKTIIHSRKNVDAEQIRKFPGGLALILTYAILQLKNVPVPATVPRQLLVLLLLVLLQLLLVLSLLVQLLLQLTRLPLMSLFLRPPLLPRLPLRSLLCLKVVF
jgi:hypothetical protein